MCEAKECQRFNRLANGSHALEDLTHTLVFRHGLGREGSMLNKMGELNPIVFIEDPKEAKANDPCEVPTKNEDLLFELIKEVIRNDFIEDLLCGLIV